MSRREEEIRDEIAAHLGMAIADKMAQGASREEAERAARAEFGNATHVAEVTRETGGGLWLERLGQDLRYGWRALRRTPAFTVVAVATLALAIGANSAVFTVVNGVLLQPLPFKDPSRLYTISYLPTGIPIAPGLGDQTFIEYFRHVSRFESVTGYRQVQTTLSGAGNATRLSGARVSSTFFHVLGVPPALGRPFTADEDRPGGDPVVILSDGLWRSRFNGDRDILGKRITLDGVPRTIVGVMPRGFTYPAVSQVWTPLALRHDPGNFSLTPTAGRLRPDATPEQARAELVAIASAVPADSQGGPHFSSYTAQLIPLKETVIGNARTPLLVLTAAVAFVLLIACANVANLLLIRAASRRHEMAVRIALGAGRGRLARQLLTESVLIALMGGGAGVVVALEGVRGLLALAPAGWVPRSGDVHLNGWVLGFTLAVSVTTGILFGLVPARSGARREPQEALGLGSRLVSAPHHRLRAGFVVGEIALALILLTGAGLMIKSFLLMRSVDLGYDATGALTMTVDLPSVAYPDAGRVQAFHQAVLERLVRIPGVQVAGAVSFRPMGGRAISGGFQVDGPTPFPNGYDVGQSAVSPGYFAAMGIRISAGRDFTPADRAGAPGVAVVSESVARRVWPGESAVGKRITMTHNPGSGDWLTVIGVVRDVVGGPQFVPGAAIYRPYLQITVPFFISHMSYVVRGALGAGTVGPAMRAALREVDPAVPAQALETMDQTMMGAIAGPVFQMRLLVTFAVLALLLAALGTYGVLAYDVTERTREIGLRMALGATPGTVLRLVLGRTATLAFAGAALGVVGSLTLTRVLSKSLFEVKPTDPATLAVVTIVLVLVALVAGYIPAQRAARIRSLTALLLG